MLFVLTAVIFFAASVLRGLLGFTTSLFVIPVLLHLGYDLSHCVTLLLSAALVQSAVGVWQLKTHVPWQDVTHATSWRLLALPIGIASVSWLGTLGSSTLKNAVGVLILLAVFLQVFARKLVPKGRGLRQASLLSGFLLGALGSGGAPMVLWTVSQNWTAQRSRAFYFALSLLCVPFGLAGLFGTFGSGILFPLLCGLAYAPIIMAGANLGVQLGNRFPRERMRGTALTVLALGALVTLSQGF